MAGRLSRRRRGSGVDQGPDGHAASEDEAIERAKEVMVQLTAYGTRGGGRSINPYDAASNGNFDDDEPLLDTWH